MLSAFGLKARQEQRISFQTRAARYMFLVVLLSVTSACSVKRGYGLMDWAMLWKIESYVDLQGAQKDAAKVALKDFEDWHRRTQLSQYAAYLRTLQERLNKGPIDSQFIHTETDKVQLFLDQSLHRLLPDVARIASTLSDEQVAQLLKNLAKRRGKFEDEYVNISPKDQLEKREDKLKDHLDNWLGSLTRPQKNLLQDWAKSLEPYEAQTALQQKQWAEQVGTIMQKRKDSETLLRELRNLSIYRGDSWDKDVKAMVDRNQERTYSLVARIINNMSDKQRSRFNKKLDDYIKDLEALASSA